MLVAIVEDTPADRERVVAWMRRYWTERGEREPLSIAAYSSGDEFISALHPGQFSLVLMDCRMEGADGMEAAKALRTCDKDAAIIFTTSSRDYAVDGYQVSASGYLVKPYSYEDFAHALTLAWSKLPGLQACLRLADVKGGAIFLKNIVYCDIDKHYAQIHLPGPEVIRVRMTFAKLLESLLPYPQFLACYRGCVINIDHVYKMEKLNFLMDTGERVPFCIKERTKLMRQYSAHLFEKTRRASQ